MKATLEGRIDLIKDKEVINDKFSKQVVRITEDSKFPSTFGVEFVNDNMSLVDNLQAGMYVSVEVRVKGRIYNDKEYSNLQGTSVQIKSGYTPAQQTVPTQESNPITSNPFG